VKKQGTTQTSVIDKMLRYRTANIQAARLILADITRYGGPSSLVARWANTVISGASNKTNLNLDVSNIPDAIVALETALPATIDGLLEVGVANKKSLLLEAVMRKSQRARMSMKQEPMSVPLLSGTNQVDRPGLSAVLAM
jgi:hypothetical protein